VSRLDAPIDRLTSHRSELEHMWNGLEATWRDGKRQAFGRVHMQVLARSTSETMTALRTSARLIDAALRTLR
jgi:hypothetical protein